MRFSALFLAFALALGAGTARSADAPPVQTILGQWQDTERNNRIVPYKIYYTSQATSAQPVVIFSHGLGGNREGSEFLLSYLAANGYVAVAVQHPGSDTPTVFGDVTATSAPSSIDPDRINRAMKQAMSPSVAVDRFRDIPFAITMLVDMNAHDRTAAGSA